MQTDKFQFHKGTIKTVGEGNGVNKQNRFQFHKGTIKTNEIDRYLQTVKLFQFHKGTIKTYYEYLHNQQVN